MNLTFLIFWWIIPLVSLRLLFLVGVKHLHGPIQQQDGEDKESVEQGQDTAYLTNLKDLKNYQK